MTIVRPTGGSAAQGDDRSARPQPAAAAGDLDSTVPFAIREERVESQVQVFERAGYRVEQRSPLQAVMVREHRRSLAARVKDALRTAGVVPVLMGAPRAYHRVVITVGTDGAVSLI